MEKKKHLILDHTIIAYFLLLIFSVLIIGAGGLIDTGIGKIWPDYAMEQVDAATGRTKDITSGVGYAIGALAALQFFYLYFRREYKGVLKKRNLVSGLLMMAPVLAVGFTGSVISWIQFGTAGILLALLRSSAAGFGEEVMFRGLGVANFMRTIKSEKQIMIIFWLSSLVFGLAHMGNVNAGANVMVSLLQSLSAIGIGMFYVAIYLRTGNLWPTIIAHMCTDFLEFIRADVGGTGGTMVTIGIGDWFSVASGVLGGIYGLYLVSHKFRPQIMEIWRDKWAVKET